MVIKEDKAPEKNRFLKEGFSTGSLYIRTKRRKK